MPDFMQIQRKLVDVLLTIPGMTSFSMRDSLLQGLPLVPLVRDHSIPRLDLNNIISGLNQLGRLNDEGGTRPLIVIAENALSYVPESGETAKALHSLITDLTEYYGGDIQPEPQDLPSSEQEALIFGTQRDNRLTISFIKRALLTSRSIARLSVPRIFNGTTSTSRMYGTGWLIAPSLLITNHHVIEARDRRPRPIGAGEAPASRQDLEAQASQVIAWFDYHDQENGAPLSCRKATLVADNIHLDYALLQLTETTKIADRNPLPIVANQQLHLERGSRLNIVQHSGGGPLQYAIRNNFFVQRGKTPDFIRYQTDTEGGASGSPVCNDSWQVVALHHSSRQISASQVPQEVIDGNPIKVTVLNEATTLYAILNDLPQSLKRYILASQPSADLIE